jgi:hypothetical protein
MTDRFVLGPRFVYDPTEDFPSSALALPPTLLTGGPITRLRAAGNTVLAFYRDPLAWLALVLSSLILCYLGGLVMFWYHAVQLGEGGPAISWYAHWMLDSTFGFVALTPALAVILPIAAGAAQTLAASRRTLPWLHTAIAGGLFALITTPGPIAHDLLVGRGTWVANQMTAMIGNRSQPLTPVRSYPTVVELAQQLGAGLPIYLSLMGLSMVLIRMLVSARHGQGFAFGGMPSRHD